MSKCCCNNTKFFTRPNNAGICPSCHPCEETLNSLEATATCPPIGEPKLLTVMAPVVFDESGINLCRVVCIDDLVDTCEDKQCCRKTDIIFNNLSKEDLREANQLQLQVIDIDFNFSNPCHPRSSELKPARNTPNLTRVVLRDLNVTFSVKVLNCQCRVVKEGAMTVRYLGAENTPGYDEVTNPHCIMLDLYTPYGIGYLPECIDACHRLTPNINFIGFIQDLNNSISQGISSQALAKVIAYEDGCFAIGLSLYLKSIYFVQYKLRHEGICVPPKFSPLGQNDENNCLNFVNGDLLEQTIQPLEVGERPKTIKDPCKDSCKDPCKNPCKDPCRENFR